MEEKCITIISSLYLACLNKLSSYILNRPYNKYYNYTKGNEKLKTNRLAFTPEPLCLASIQIGTFEVRSND
ncbi:hypothetical protein [Bacillus thuringiensis]|uniref:hypothetical protein n=1 Tax=Bacillus thuringiensis TaxID=1428 RepID=UPI001071AD91|nr:hypothetical protein [Bacillus thuringiensis]